MMYFFLHSFLGHILSSISLFVKVVPYSLVSPKDTVVQSMSPGIGVPLFCSEGRYKPCHLALVCDLNWIAFLRCGWRLSVQGHVDDEACLEIAESVRIHRTHGNSIL